MDCFTSDGIFNGYRNCHYVPGIIANGSRLARTGNGDDLLAWISGVFKVNSSNQ